MRFNLFNGNMHAPGVATTPGKLEDVTKARDTLFFTCSRWHIVSVPCSRRILRITALKNVLSRRLRCYSTVERPQRQNLKMLICSVKILLRRYKKLDMESSKFKMSVHSCALFSTCLPRPFPASEIERTKIALQKLKKNLFRNWLLIVAEMDCTTQLLFLTQMVSSLLLGLVMNCESICGIFNMVKNCQTESFTCGFCGLHFFHQSPHGFTLQSDIFVHDFSCLSSTSREVAWSCGTVG